MDWFFRNDDFAFNISINHLDFSFFLINLPMKPIKRSYWFVDAYNYLPDQSFNTSLTAVLHKYFEEKLIFSLVQGYSQIKYLRKVWNWVCAVWWWKIKHLKPLESLFLNRTQNCYLCDVWPPGAGTSWVNIYHQLTNTSVAANVIFVSALGQNLFVSFLGDLVGFYCLWGVICDNGFGSSIPCNLLSAIKQDAVF